MIAHLYGTYGEEARAALLSAGRIRRELDETPAPQPSEPEALLKLSFVVPLDEYSERLLVARVNSPERNQFLDELDIRLTLPERCGFELVSHQVAMQRYCQFTKRGDPKLKVETGFRVKIAPLPGSYLGNEGLSPFLAKRLTPTVTSPLYPKPFTARLISYYKK